MPLLIKKSFVDDRYIRMDVHEVHVKVVHDSLVIWHQLRRYSHLEIRARQRRREHMFVLINILKSGFFKEGLGLVFVVQVRGYYSSEFCLHHL